MATQATAELMAQMANMTDRNRGPGLLHTVWSLLAVSTLVVAGRLLAKTRRTSRLYWDDLALVLALLFGYAHALCISRAVHYGMGRHIIFIPAQQREHTLRDGVISLAWGFLSPMAGRVSFLITMLFLAKTDAKVKRWPIYIFIFLQLAVNIVVLIIFYTQCGREIDILWLASKQNLWATKCWDPRIQTDLGYFQGSINVATDLYLTVLPAVLIEHTRLSRKSKIGLVFLLCLSIDAMIASIVKTYEAKALSSILDYTWDLCPYVIWMSVELNIVIIVSSIPFLRPFFHQNKAMNRSRFEMSSIFSKGGSRTGMSEITTQPGESQENLTPTRKHASGSVNFGAATGITVTREVEVAYGAQDAPFVHAALVGLVQGEVSRRRPVRTNA